MIRGIIMLVTFVVLGWGWYVLSGGSEFVAGDNGVKILADPKPVAPPVTPQRTTLQLRDAQPDPDPASEPRVTSLQTRDPLPSKTVRVPERPAVAPAPAEPPDRVTGVVPESETPEMDRTPLKPQALDDVALALKDALRNEDGADLADPAPQAAAPASDPVLLPEAAEPVDEIARALSEAVRDGVVPDPAAPAEAPDPNGTVPRIAGLSEGLPLGAPVDGGLQGGGVGPLIAPDLADFRVVSGTRVNLRDGPSTDFEVLTQLFEGDEVEVLDDTDDGWVHLRVLGTEEIGWMSEDFLQSPGQGGPSSP